MGSQLFTHSHNLCSAGIGNRLFVCEVTGGSDAGKGHSPNRVLLRLYGGNLFEQDVPLRTLNPSLEVMLFYAMSQKGIGPQVYGCFDGGRIEEFIDGRNLSIDEWVSSPDFNKKIAKQVARYHMVNFPISREPWDVEKKILSCYQPFLKNKERIMKEYLTPDQLDECRPLIEYDVLSDLKFIMDMLPQVNSRIVFAHNDINRHNVMMRNMDQDVRLIDYEFSSYNYRGCDLGNHFACKKFDLGASKLDTGAPLFPSREYLEQFIEAYVRAIRESGDAPADWDEQGRDSVHHILIETVFGSIITRVLDMSWVLRDFEFWHPLDVERESKHYKDGNLSDFFRLMPDFCQQQKDLFHQLWNEYQHKNGVAP